MNQKLMLILEARARCSSRSTEVAVRWSLAEMHNFNELHQELTHGYEWMMEIWMKYSMRYWEKEETKGRNEVKTDACYACRQDEPECECCEVQSLNCSNDFEFCFAIEAVSSRAPSPDAVPSPGATAQKVFFWRMRYRVPWNHSCKQVMIVNSHWFVSSMHAVSSLSKFGSISLLDVTANPSIIEKNVERNSLSLQKLSALIGSLPCKTFCYLGDRHYSACQARDSKLRH